MPAKENRTTPRKKAKELSKYLRKENPDYNYLKQLFRYLREELEIEIPAPSRKLPYVPTEEEIKRYYDVIWNEKNFKDMLIIKTLIYTGVRVSELVNIKIEDINFTNCQIRVIEGKGKKDRMVPFPEGFKEILGIHCDSERKNGATYLFESSWKKKYTTRGIRKILEKYSEQAGLKENISPHKLRHFLFTWLKKQGIDDAFIQPFSGHESRKNLEIYSKLTISEAQEVYNDAIKKFPI